MLHMLTYALLMSDVTAGLTSLGESARGGARQEPQTLRYMC